DRHPSSVSSRNYFVGVGGSVLQRKCRLTRRIGIPRRLVVTLPLSELCKSPIPRGQQPAPSCPEAASSAKPRTFDRWLLQCKRLLAPPGTNVAPVARYGKVGFRVSSWVAACPVPPCRRFESSMQWTQVFSVSTIKILVPRQANCFLFCG